MPDTSHLEGLDPYDLLDREAARIDAYLSTLPDTDPAWEEPTRCDGWSVRDVLAHLAATEQYHQACLDGAVADLLTRAAESGVVDIASWNEQGIRERDDSPPSAVLDEWRRADEVTRRSLRAADGGEMDTSVGPYPVRFQAFHVASELATHADDLGVPSADAEVAERLAWRVRFSRFALTEAKPELHVAAVAGGTQVAGDAASTAELVDDEAFVEAVAGRLPPGVLTADVAAALSTMP